MKQQLTHLAKQLITSVLFASLIYACGTRRAGTTVQAGKQTDAQTDVSALYARLKENNATWLGLKAKLKTTLSLGNKSHSLRTQLQAVRGQGLKLSLHYLLFEVARLWFTPETVVLVDMVNGYYAEEPYSSFGTRLGISIDYTQIESLIMGGVSIPQGAKDLSYTLKRQGQVEGLGWQELSFYHSSYTHSYMLDLSLVVKTLLVSNRQGAKVFEAQYQSNALYGLPMHTTPASSKYSIYSQSAQEPKANLLIEWESLQMVDDVSSLNVQVQIKDRYKRIDLGTILEAL